MESSNSHFKMTTLMDVARFWFGKGICFSSSSWAPLFFRPLDITLPESCMIFQSLNATRNTHGVSFFVKWRLITSYRCGNKNIIATKNCNNTGYERYHRINIYISINGINRMILGVPAVCPLGRPIGTSNDLA